MNTARRILIIQDFLRSGGTERQTLLLAEAFAGAGREVLLRTFRPGGTLSGKIPAAVNHAALQPFDMKLDWFAPRLRRAVADAAPDVVLCMGRMANCRAGGIKRAFPQLPVICTMRTGKPLPWLFRRSLRTADAVIANSAAAGKTLTEKWGIPSREISVIHNAPVFAPETSPTPAASAAEPLIAVCVAMFRPEKNHAALLRIFERLPATLHWRLVLAGDGAERANLAQAVLRSPALAGRVEFVGFCADPRPLYRRASIAVLPSLRESLPNFLVEAHLHGVPSVAFDVGGVAECAGNVVPAGDEAAFAAQLERMFCDAAFRVAESERVRVFAEKHFTRAAQTDAHLALFDALV